MRNQQGQWWTKEGSVILERRCVLRRVLADVVDPITPALSMIALGKLPTAHAVLCP